MSLSSLHLDAFLEITRQGSFSRAAKSLHITQSALSQRIHNLEETLGMNVFTRENSGVLLTAAGEKLLNYCRSKDALESEFLSEVHHASKELSGMVTIAGFSTFVRSRLIPKLGEIKRIYPQIHFDVLTKEISELTAMLRSSQADFVFSNQKILKHGVENTCIGVEKNVLIESSLLDSSPEYVFIDHDESDTTTFEFLKIQTRKIPIYKRAYFDEVYSIIDAVAEGFGRAVVPLHLIQHNSKIHVLPGWTPLETPIFFSYPHTPTPTKLHKHLVEIFSQTLFFT